MTADQIASEIFIGAVVGLITALINKSFQENINPWIIVGVAIAAIILYGIVITLGNTPPFIPIAAVLCTVLLGALLYRGYVTGFGRSPYIKWRVKHTASEWDERKKRGKECLGLICDGELIGKEGEEACQFRCEHFSAGVYGPYIAHLPRNKYRAVFRIKAGRISNKNETLIHINVAAEGINEEGKPQDGYTELTHCDLSYVNFSKADAYQNFPVNFNILFPQGASKVEFRIDHPGHGPIMTLDYIQLYKRLF
jgi:hypothetical protein